MKKPKRRSEIEELANITLKLGLLFERSLDSIANSIGLTFQQAQILRFLRYASPIIMTGLAEEFGLTPSAMTGSINRLVKQKLVLRKYEPKDRRIILILITGTGKTKSKNYEKKVKTFAIKMLKDLSRSEKADLLKLLKSIYKSPI
ncbi:MAG: MarR family transcriptional regulator [Candidatus Omnitrophica bacterium]|nr:MarR family transcriptional regulator [Candidatus Omnitrophota bacterium]